MAARARRSSAARSAGARARVYARARAALRAHIAQIITMANNQSAGMSVISKRQ